MNNSKIREKLDDILMNGDNFQKNIINKCISVVHYEVSQKNSRKDRKNFADYKNRIEHLFNCGTNEQVSSLIGSLLVQEYQIEKDSTSH